MLVTDLVHMNLSLFLQIMDIHSFMKLNFSPDISVLPQYTHTRSIHDGGLCICASWQASE